MFTCAKNRSRMDGWTKYVGVGRWILASDGAMVWMDAVLEAFSLRAQRIGEVRWVRDDGGMVEWRGFVSGFNLFITLYFLVSLRTDFLMYSNDYEEYLAHSF